MKTLGHFLNSLYTSITTKGSWMLKFILRKLLIKGLEMTAKKKVAQKKSTPKEDLSKFRKKELAGGPRILHVVASNLRAWFEKKDPNYMIAVREAGQLADGVMARRVVIHGSSTLVERKETPLPGSDGRAVCYIETKAPLTVYFDKKHPEPVKVVNTPC
jgi:hypothetical protein